MQIRRIEVRAFRKLKHQVVDNLGPGLNVLVGDNEAGKSTLLAALRAVLFERHRVGGKVVAAMLPHGHEVRPEITVDFTLRNGHWRLRKAFNQSPEAELTMPGGQIVTGDAVEDRMAALLGFEAPGNRGSKQDEHQGIYGLLWVDQGLAHGSLSAGGGQDALSAALETEVGQVLGGERGRHLLARAESRRDVFWDKRDKPRGPFRQLADEVEELELRLATLDGRMRGHDEKVAALAVRTDALARHTRDDRLNGAVKAMALARAAADRAAQLDAAVADLRRGHAHAVLEHQTAADRLRDRQARSDKVAAGALAASRAREAEAVVRDTLRRAEAESRTALARLTACRTDRAAIDARLDALERSAAQRKARLELVEVSRRLRDAETAARRRHEARGATAAIAMTPSELQNLDKLCAARDAAAARRDAASVQIVAEGADAGFTVDGIAHAAGQPLLLSADAVLDLPGFGRLRIRPGGGVEALARTLSDADVKVVAALRRLGFESREGAAAALARKTEAEATVAEQDRLLAFLAPEGIDALHLAADRLAAVAASSSADSSSADAVETAEEADHDGAALRDHRNAAIHAERDAEAELKRADAAREAVSRETAVLGERLAGLAREHDAAVQALDAARASVGDERLAGALVEAEGTAARAAAALASAETALSAADPEVARLGLRKAEEAEKAIRADVDRLLREKRDLEIELRTLGQDGLGEQMAETEGRLDAARRRLAAQSTEAQASLLLHRTLSQASRETKDRWLGPVRDRVRPYLKLIQPGTEIVLNEKTFGIEHLLRDGVPEPFESLSVGAREQVAVITRLALAEILHASGQPAAIILDDALVNTDETRLDRMHLVLQRAAENLQVLVLTCRERDFIGLGAPIHRL